MDNVTSSRFDPDQVTTAPSRPKAWLIFFVNVLYSFALSTVIDKNGIVWMYGGLM